MDKVKAEDDISPVHYYLYWDVIVCIIALIPCANIEQLWLMCVFTCNIVLTFVLFFNSQMRPPSVAMVTLQFNISFRLVADLYDETAD